MHEFPPGKFHDVSLQKKEGQALLTPYLKFSRQPPVLFKVFFNERSQLRWRSTDGLLGDRKKSFANCGVNERFAHLCVQTGNDGGWRATRDKSALPGRKHKAFNARFLERWHIRQAWRALLRGLRDHAQRAGLGVRDNSHRAKNTDANVPGDQVIDSLARASVGYVFKFDRGELGEPFPDEMLLGACTGSGIAHV
jgi:hypothetical protein